MTDTLRIPDEIAFKAVDPKAYADGTVHDAFRWLRANQPLGRAELEGVEPFWLVTKHADILDAVRNDREIKPETDKKLRGVLEAFVKTFAA